MNMPEMWVLGPYKFSKTEEAGCLLSPTILCKVANNHEKNPNFPV